MLNGRRIIAWLIGLGCIAAVVLAAAIGGYYSHAQQITPMARLLPKVEQKIRELRGEPTLFESRIAKIETTFVQLRGTLMRPPGIDWVNGGALTVRDEQLIIMDRLGRFYSTDGAAPIRRLADLSPPDNGVPAYREFAASPEGAKLTHNISRIRFNDVQWVDTVAGTGLVLSYTFFDPERVCYGTRLAWLDAERDAPLAASPEDWRILFETRPCLAMNVGRLAIEGLAAGGRMAFEAPSTIYLGSGDYHLDGIVSNDIGIQDPDTSYGKVLAIDVATGEDRVVSIGHRNTQGVALTPDGRLFVTEHGIRGGDELNLIKEGGNYGWPETTLGTLYSGQPVPDITYGRHDVGTPPVYSWLPSAAVSSLMAIDGLDPAWDGDLLAGSLSGAQFGQSLWRIRVRDNSSVEFVERIRLGERVRYLTQFGDRIAVWLDNNNLILFDVVRREDPLEGVNAYLAANYDAETAEAVQGVLATCNQCHSFAQNENRAGPSLNGVMGRAVAGANYPSYSEALRGLGGKWTPERLAAYLVDPEAVAPGTSMPASGLQEGPLLDALVDALSTIDSNAGSHLTYN